MPSGPSSRQRKLKSNGESSNKASGSGALKNGHKALRVWRGSRTTPTTMRSVQYRYAGRLNWRGLHDNDHADRGAETARDRYRRAGRRTTPERSQALLEICAIRYGLRITKARCRTQRKIGRNSLRSLLVVLFGPLSGSDLYRLCAIITVMSNQDDDAAARFRRQAEEAREQAATALSPLDKEAWLRLAEDWLKLAVSVDGRSKG
jgi:hypothetical protein